MENKKLKLNFEMRIKDIDDNDDRFARAKVLIAYCGRNRNYSDISKEVFESTPIANIPVVARYDSEKDDFGGHDIRVIKDGDSVDIVNATVPFGVVPESAEQWFEEAVVDGEIKNCFCTDVILWKRQYGYEHIAKAKTINQSMEIDVSDYTIDNDGYCIVNKMKFEALTLLGDDVEPCFENSRLTLYNKAGSFEEQYKEMLEQYKAYSLKLRNEVNDMENENKNIEPEVNENPTEDTTSISPDSTELTPEDNGETKNNNVTEESENTEETPNENADNTPVDYSVEYSNLKEQYDALVSEVEELRTYKANIEKEKRESEENSVFSKFDSKLGHIEDYTNLKNNCSEYSIEEIEEKCYAIVGRYGISMIEAEQSNDETSAKFSLGSEEKPESPYGNVFKEYAN